MSVWTVVLVSSAVVFALKVAGHLVPTRFLENPAIARAALLVTAGLLAALVTVQTFADGQRLALDARSPAVGVAAVLLWFRAPFILVVAAAAVVAALIRLVS